MEPTREAQQPAGTATTAAAAGGQKPKPCCVCLETKKARDSCYFDHGDGAEQKCHYLVDAHRKCMADFGFKI
ncbi:Cytochrome c oxidase copper chaperone [Coemansia nantahalensis]|uniref:Cytochrome c oxidase copper chaperone n=1 Tax=Coemansia helicoidea TaxID=1286919 RepID=A0ACC1LAH0_9FUNG|nr:Cytochrome c oxidase copper chaperone [Coemansia nantahalensis]KAJ2804271.1 Cytochrome c oxidase copper chaperone [Coemansia helicoidea]